MAKVGEERALNAERHQRAEEEKTAGILNLVKAIKELQGMDIEQLERKINILKNLSETATETYEADQKATSPKKSPEAPKA